MTFWINQHVSETKELITQWRNNRTVKCHAVVDHVELAGSHTILGLMVEWENLNEKPITIIEIQVVLYEKGHEDVLLRLLPLERFGRQDIQRTLLKTPLSQFKLKPHEPHTEQIRFISHESREITAGVYTVEVQIRDTNHHSYTRRMKIEVENRMKYRLTDDWTETTEKAHV
jgi:hypothetical protein